MTRFKIGVAALGLVIGAIAGAPAKAWDRSRVEVLTVLPDVTKGVQSSVEGLTVGPDGNIYVPTFGFNTNGALTGNAVFEVRRGPCMHRQQEAREYERGGEQADQQRAAAKPAE